jgi:Holliday junction resolvase RusA-like endonuclease
VSDAINGIAFPDDRYVRTIVAALAQDRERPRVEVEVREVAA